MSCSHSFPHSSLASFDQFVSSRILDRYPQLYMLGQSNAFFTKTAFWLWVGNALYQSIVRTCSPIYPMDDTYRFVQVAFGFSIILFWGDLKQPTGF